MVNGSSVEPNLVVVGVGVGSPDGDGDHSPSSWPVTEDNSPGGQGRKLSSGYGDDWDDDSSLSSWSVIEDDYPNLPAPTVTEIELKATPGKRNEVRSTQSVNMRTYFNNWLSDCTADSVSFPASLELEWKDSKGKPHKLSWPDQEFNLDGHSLCSSGDSKRKADLKIASELTTGPFTTMYYVGRVRSNNNVLYDWLTKGIEGRIWVDNKWLDAKQSIGCSSLAVHKTWTDDTSITLQPDPRVCQNSDEPLYVTTPETYSTSSFYTINETTKRPASEIYAG